MRKAPDKKSNSLMLIESIYKLFTHLEGEHESKFLLDYVEDIKRVIKRSVEQRRTVETVSYIVDFSSKGQLKSKLWLAQTLKKLKISDLGRVFLCAGWCGFLAYLLLQDKFFKIERIFNFDIDPLSIEISENLNRRWVKEDWKFKASLKNILDLDYSSAEFETLRKDGSSQKLIISPDTIINTSCEHIEDFANWRRKLAKDKLIILQSNNFFSHKEHINCVAGIEEFEEQALLDTVWFRGELDLGEYKRFMLIGKNSSA